MHMNPLNASQYCHMLTLANYHKYTKEKRK